MELRLPRVPGRAGRLASLPAAYTVVGGGQRRLPELVSAQRLARHSGPDRSLPCPSSERDQGSSPLRSVLLTDAELDHTLGLLLLREADDIEIHCTEAVHETLLDGTALLQTLGAYSGVRWRPVAMGQEASLGDGLSYQAFGVPTNKTARFRIGAGGESVVGYRITDMRTGRALVYVPGAQQLTAPVREQLESCACLLFDGTCWQDDEMVRLGIARKTARDMGHVPISGEDGSLEKLAPLPVERKIYIHINNTNPVLIEDSPERRAVEERGLEVAFDGLELEI